MKTLFAALATLTLLLQAPLATAAGDAEAGAQKAAVCGACHGMDGNSFNPEWPSLAGQSAEYIAAQLALFKSGTRDNVLMSPNASILSEQDMADLGAYYARLKPAGLEADPAIYQRGETLYRGGDTERGLPACIACHGPRGEGNGPAQYPALRAQHANYTVIQLQAYANGSRKFINNDIMHIVASKLSEEEMRALASYVQGLR